ncbi:SDR family oxidoreductase [Streptomyces pristinaespiralis]|uniref:SDR family oxidoreductase n=1 Tax=Streptomyces pristinaespiralis TaxID=38300 RepID=UPI0028701EBF|nr:NAD(P)H-binding protein [Streptomyces pristinaespiralis]
MTILVTGSRGKVGSALVTLLHRQGLRVRAGSASPGDLTFPADVETVRCALDDPSTFPAALDSVTSVFLYAEPSHTDAFVAQAHAAGVGHIVLLSSSAVMSSDAADNPIAASHLLAEQALAAGPVEATVLRPERSRATPSSGRVRCARPAPWTCRTRRATATRSMRTTSRGWRRQCSPGRDHAAAPTI